MSCAHGLWFVTLASGADDPALPTAARGRATGAPVQFCSLPDGPSPFVAALARAERFADACGHLVFVGSAHRSLWQDGLRAGHAGGAPDPVVFLEREPRGSGVALLTALSYLVQVDAGAIVVVQSPHVVVDDEPVLDEAIATAIRHARGEDNRVIVPIFVDGSARRPRAPRGHAPPAGAARGRSGLAVGRASAFVRAFDQVDRPLLRLFLAAARTAKPGLPSTAEVVYPPIGRLDLEVDVLAASVSVLRTLTVPPCGALDLRDRAQSLRRLRRGQTEGRSAQRGPLPSFEGKILALAPEEVA